MGILFMFLIFINFCYYGYWYIVCGGIFWRFCILLFVMFGLELFVFLFGFMMSFLFSILRGYGCFVGILYIIFFF